MYTGLLKYTKDEAGLAAVIGHEIGHVAAHHSAERLSHAMLVKSTLAVADATLAASKNKNRPLISSALGLGAQFGVMLPYSREHELEADRIGQIYMAKAGYEPSASVELWERMDATGSGRNAFFSTHPSNEQRRTELKRHLPEAKIYFANQDRPLPNGLDDLRSLRLAATYSDAPEGLLPKFKPGYWYEYKPANAQVPVRMTYQKISDCGDGECIDIVSSDGASGVVTRDFKFVQINDKNGGWAKFSPGLQRIRFPVRVGDKWEVQSTLETSAGIKSTALFKAEVVGYEEVTVPAGTFMAYKTVTSVGNVKFYEGWYVPEVRMFVRFKTGGLFSSVTNELTAYQTSDDPTAEFSAN